MKEQINRQLEKKSDRRPAIKVTVIALLAFVAILGGGIYASQLMAAPEQKTSAPPAMPPMPVETVEVKIADSDQQLQAVGTLLSNEAVIIMSEIPGRIETIGFREGEAVKKGQLLIKLDSSVLMAEFDRAEASRALSEKNYQRSEALFNDNAISEMEHDEAYAKWKLDEATTRLAKAQLQKTIIKNPFAGTLGLRNVSIGDYIQPGQPLVNLEDVSQLKVDFTVPEKYSTQIKVNQKLSVTTDAYEGRSFNGEVYAINPLVDAKTRSLVLRGRIDNQEGLIRPGQFAQVKLVLSTKTDAIFIPEQALIPQPAKQFVFKVVDGAAQMVPVQTGQRRKGWVEIVDGLAAGDVVITGGHQKIGPGSPVHVIPAAPSLFSKFESDIASPSKSDG